MSWFKKDKGLKDDRKPPVQKLLSPRDESRGIRARWSRARSQSPNPSGSASTIGSGTSLSELPIRQHDSTIADTTIDPTVATIGQRPVSSSEPPISSKTGTTTVTNTSNEPALLNATASAAKNDTQGKLSPWDEAYNGLRAKKDPKIQKLMNEYEILIQEQLLSTSIPSAAIESAETIGTSSAISVQQSSMFDPVERHVRLEKLLDESMNIHETKGKIVIGSHIISARDVIANLAKGADFAKDWIGKAVEASPEASVAWALICLGLPLLTKPAEAETANLDGLAYVSSRMHYYMALEALLFSEHVPSASISVREELRLRLVELYQSILDYQIRSIIRLRKTSWYKEIFQADDWQTMQACIKVLEETFEKDTSSVSRNESRLQLQTLIEDARKVQAEMNQLSRAQIKELKNIGSLLQKQFDASEQTRLLMQGHEIQRRNDIDTEKTYRCIQALRLDSFYEDFKDRIQQPISGTCQWFLSQPSYIQWRESPGGCLLISADPGCGKSVLAKHILEDQLRQHDPEGLRCYFFFKDQIQSSLNVALSALLHQLLSARTDMVKHLLPAFDKDGEKLPGNVSVLYDALRDVLLDPHMQRVTFVLDALDECQYDDMKKLLNLIAKINNPDVAAAKHKFILTTRPYPEIVSCFHNTKGHLHIHVPGHDKAEEISKEVSIVIKYRCNELLDKGHISKKVHERLLEILLGQANNTYLYVYLVFEELEQPNRRQQTPKEFDRWSKTLPRNVDEAYEKILSRYTVGDGEVASKVRRILRVMLAAKRTLSIQELECATKVDIKEPPVYHEDLDLEESIDNFRSKLLGWCGLFLQVHGDQVIFLHQTAREFLLMNATVRATVMSDSTFWAHSIDLVEAHTLLATICIKYLCLEDFAAIQWSQQPASRHLLSSAAALSIKGDSETERDTEDDRNNKRSSIIVGSGLHIDDDTISHDNGNAFDNDESWFRNKYKKSLRSRYKLLDYAAAHWEDHYVEGNCERHAQALEDAFRLYNNQRGTFETWTRMLRDKFYDTSLLFSSRFLEPIPVIVAATMRSRAILERLIHEIGVPSDPELMEAALHIAVFHQQEQNAILLLERGVNPNGRINSDLSVLASSIIQRMNTVTDLLLRSGVRVDVESLNAALRVRDTELFTILMGHDADFNVFDLQEQGLLESAVALDMHDAVELLLRNGAPIDGPSFSDHSLLQLAAMRGHLPTLRVLLRHNVDMEHMDGAGNTALCLASKFGRQDVAEVLLDHNAAIIPNHTRRRSALHAAAGGLRGRQYVGGNLVTITIEAYLDTIKLLLRAGAYVDAPDSEGCTALMLAADRTDHQRRTLDCLLENGAEAEIQDQNGRSALYYVYNEEALQVLLEHGLNLNTQDVFGQTPILFAMIKPVGYDDDNFGRLVALYDGMLKAGADPRIEDADGLFAPRCLDGRFSAFVDTVRLVNNTILLVDILSNPWWTQSSINLDSCLRCQNGTFAWAQDGHFSASARDIRLVHQDRVLQAELIDDNGCWKRAYVWLDEKLAVVDERLKFLGAD